MEFHECDGGRSYVMSICEKYGREYNERWLEMYQDFRVLGNVDFNPEEEFEKVMRMEVEK